MKVIAITRRGNQVTFATVAIDVTENVVFSNEDPQEAHWPTLGGPDHPTCTNQLGPAPSPNSSECPVPAPSTPYRVTYGCKYHAQEQGTIDVYAVLAPPKSGTALAAATVNQRITEQLVVLGGQPPYTISGQLFQVIDASKQVIEKGSGIGPGLQLNQSAAGITVSGTPTAAGTYTFTFTVDDSMGRNLQQTQYTMVVSA